MEVLREVNRQLFPDMKEDMFISMAYVILDHEKNEVTLARAGHDAPFLYRAQDGQVSKLNPPGMALGVDSGSVFDRLTRNSTVPLEPNDCLILYTDGITEALDQNGQEFGMNRTVAAIQASAPQGAPAIVKRLTEELRAFAGNTPQNDDITLIVIASYEHSRKHDDHHRRQARRAGAGRPGPALGGGNGRQAPGRNGPPARPGVA